MAVVANPVDELAAWRVRTEERLKEMSRELLDRPAGGAEVAGKRQVSERDRAIEEILDIILDIANEMPEGVEDPGVARLLARAVALQRAASGEPTGRDPGWRVRRAVVDLKDATELMGRRLTRLRLDIPEEAARFVALSLAGVEVGRVAELLGVTTKTVSQWRGGRVESIRKNPGRVVLVAQLVHYLQTSWTAQGVIAWFNTSFQRLDGMTPLALLERGDEGAWRRLRALARGSRSQLGE